MATALMLCTAVGCYALPQAAKLGLPSVRDTESIVAKAIRWVPKLGWLTWPGSTVQAAGECRCCCCCGASHAAALCHRLFAPHAARLTAALHCFMPTGTAALRVCWTTRRACCRRPAPQTSTLPTSRRWGGGGGAAAAAGQNVHWLTCRQRLGACWPLAADVPKDHCTWPNVVHSLASLQRTLASSHVHPRSCCRPPSMRVSRSAWTCTTRCGVQLQLLSRRFEQSVTANRAQH